jgi:hypothetical protein
VSVLTHAPIQDANLPLPIDGHSAKSRFFKDLSSFLNIFPPLLGCRLIYFTFCTELLYLFLGAFAKFRKATISCLSVRPTVRLFFRASIHPHGTTCSHWTNFHEVSYLKIFRKTVDKLQSLLKADKNGIYFTCMRVYIYDNISLNSS